MQKAILTLLAAVAVLSISNGAVRAGTYPFGDPPYRLDFWYDPQVESDCLKWNWQQYQWEDHCPVYVHPKAYMYYGRYRHAVVRTKG